MSVTPDFFNSKIYNYLDEEFHELASVARYSPSFHASEQFHGDWIFRVVVGREIWSQNIPLQMIMDKRWHEMVECTRALLMTAIRAYLPPPLIDTLEHWIKHDNIWKRLQIDWRPNESIAEDYYV